MFCSFLHHPIFTVLATTSQHIDNDDDQDEVTSGITDEDTPTKKDSSMA
jgi:hypothetical protein